MTDPKTYSFNTKTLHSGHQPDKNFGSRAVPIYQTTSYLFQDADHAAALFNLEEGGHIYSRISNPTISVLEERVAALEGGSAALATYDIDINGGNIRVRTTPASTNSTVFTVLESYTV